MNKKLLNIKLMKERQYLTCPNNKISPTTAKSEVNKMIIKKNMC